MAEIRPPFKHDLDTLVRTTYLNGIFATGDALANCFAVELYKGNASYTIPSGATVKGYFVRQKDNATVVLSGTKSGNVASVTLSSECYNLNGPFTLTIKVIEDSATTTVFYGAGSMIVSRTGTTIALGSEAVEYEKGPYNWIDNGNFANSVNQRGQTTYTGAVYGIDRWVGGTSVTQVDIVTGSDNFNALKLTHAGDASIAGISQKFRMTEPRLYGRRMTAAICLDDGTIYAVSATITSATSAAVTIPGGTLQLYIPESNVLAMRIYVTVGNSITIKWAALYEGTYTAETLPPYVPKPYSVELAECQRYYVRLNAAGELGFAGYAQSDTVARITIPLPNAMRIESPTLTVTYRTNVSIYPGSIMPTSIDSVKCVGHVAAIVMTCSGLTASEPLVMKPNAIIELSADL